MNNLIEGYKTPRLGTYLPTYTQTFYVLYHLVIIVYTTYR